MLVTILQFVILVFQGLIFLFGIYLRSYFQRKGENMATKEDIAEITAKIEGVKTTYKQRYDILIAEREFYNELIKAIEGFLAEIKKREFEMGTGKDSLTKEMIMQDEELRQEYFNFIDLTNVIMAKTFVFLGEENWTNFKNAIEKHSDFAHMRINLLDAMRKSIYPDTQLKAIKDSKNFPY